MFSSCKGANCLTGSFPTELGRLTNLKSAGFEHNFLVGDLNPILCASFGNEGRGLLLEDYDYDYDYEFQELFAADCLQIDVLCDCCDTCCNDETCINFLATGDDGRYTPNERSCQSQR